MSALNSSETEQLRAVRTVLEHVLRHGFDPTSESAAALHTGKALKDASKAVHTITQMKGYYPND